MPDVTVVTVDVKDAD